MRLEAIEERISVSHPWQRVGNAAALTDGRGVFDANHVLTSSLRHLGQTRLRASAPGYEDAFLYDPFNILSASPTQVTLKEHPECRLRFLNCGDPLDRRVVIFQEGDGEEMLLFNGLPSARGVVEFRGADRSNVSVRLGNRSGPLIAQVEASTTLADVDVDCSASLVVEGGDAATEIVCAIGAWEPPCEIDAGGRLLFQCLPPGDYDVGSRESVSAARLYRGWNLVVESVRLASGQQKTVHASSAVGQLVGQCQVVGTQASNVRVSVRGDGVEAGPFAFRPADVWTSVQTDGRFFVSGSRTPDPWIAYALVGVEGVAIPLGTHRLSEQPSITCRHLMVRVDDEVVMPTRIRFTPLQDQASSLTTLVEWRLTRLEQSFWIPDSVGRIAVVDSESMAVADVQKGSDCLTIQVGQDKDGKLNLQVIPR